MKHFGIGCILFLIASCNYEKQLAKWCERCPQHDSVVVQHEVVSTTTYDTTYVPLPADSSWYFALIECQKDSGGKYMPVVIKQTTKGGKKTYVAANIDSTGMLTVDCIALNDTILALKQTITRYEVERSKSNSTKIVPCPDCSLKWWQKFLMWCGAIGLIYAIIRLTWFVAKQFPQVKGLSWAAKIISFLK